MLPHDDDTHDLGRWLYHLATWLEGAEPRFCFFVRPTPAPGTIIDHSIGAKVLVAVQGPWAWRLRARAGRKKLPDASLEYTRTVILVTYGEVVRGC